jgi:tight adherence protein B
VQVLIVLLLAVVFTVVLAAGQTAYWAYIARQERESKEMLRRLNMMSETMAESLFRERARDAAVSALGRLGAHLQETIEAADSQTQVSTLLAQSLIISLVGMVVGFLFVGVLGALVGLAPGIIPYLLMRRAGAQRSKKLVEQLPEALDLMARSLQAGLGLSEAFRTCAEEMPLPIAAEFGRVFEEVRFGRDYREAFLNMLKRNPGVFDLRLFVSSVLLQRETGGNLIEILESISGTIRGRFLFFAKVRAMTSEARFSAMILGGLPLCVAGLITLTNPNYLMPLKDDMLGNILLVYFFCSYTFGAFLMNRISQVEV